MSLFSDKIAVIGAMDEFNPDDTTFPTGWSVTGTPQIIEDDSMIAGQENVSALTLTPESELLAGFGSFKVAG